MNPRLWAAYAVLEAVLSATPGPAVLTVVGQAIRHGWRRSLLGSLGIVSVNALYFALSAAGVGAFLAASPRLGAGLRWAGIAFLGWTAVQHLLARREVAAADVPAADNRRSLYAQAVATQAANPKAIVFFVSLLAPFIDAHAPWPAWAQVAVYAATSVTLELPILLAYGVAASHGSRLLSPSAGSPPTALPTRLSGACLLAAAGWLALR